MYVLRMKWVPSIGGFEQTKIHVSNPIQTIIFNQFTNQVIPNISLIRRVRNLD